MSLISKGLQIPRGIGGELAGFAAGRAAYLGALVLDSQLGLNAVPWVGALVAVVLRMDYLSFNRVEARWEYVSIDTRAAVGLMTAQS